MNPPDETTPADTAPTETTPAAASDAFPVEHRFELTREYRATPDQLWAAIASADGISAWMMPTTMEAREGGAIRFEMGEESSSEGTVTAFEAPHRFAYVEPDWATMVGRERDSVTPLATEFLIEARSGGTCVLRVVSSTFGTGADWEGEFFADMEMGWLPTFDNLRLYLEHFAGRAARSFQVDLALDVAGDVAWSVLREAVGASAIGDQVRVRDLRGTIERISSSPGPNELLVRTTEPFEGFVGFVVWGAVESCVAVIVARFFTDEDPGSLDERRRAWVEWLRATMAAT